MQKPKIQLWPLLIMTSFLGVTHTSLAQMAVYDAANYAMQNLSLIQVTASSAQLLEQTTQLALELKQLDPSNYDWSKCAAGTQRSALDDKAWKV